jgi:hypothetical protein
MGHNIDLLVNVPSSLLAHHVVPKQSKKLGLPSDRRDGHHGLVFRPHALNSLLPLHVNHG